MSKFEYRSFRDFNKDQFLMDLQEVDFSYVHSARADANAAFEHQVYKIVDRHAQIKHAYQRRMETAMYEH